MVDAGEECDQAEFAGDACDIEDAELVCADDCTVIPATCCAPAGTACVVGLNECCAGCDAILGECN
jgi:hypothetical protein